ncbi:MAG: type II toxin-antitoxin system VapC family toxin, partial [Methanoregula sp.]
NVIIYAVLKPKKAVPPAVAQMKAAAREIFLRVNAGEPVVMTTVHTSEVANVLEDAAGLPFATELLSALLLKQNITVEPVAADDYRESVQYAMSLNISINDALAVIVMERQGIDEIYTFDKHFRQAPVRIVQE